MTESDTQGAGPESDAGPLGPDAPEASDDDGADRARLLFWIGIGLATLLGLVLRGLHLDIAMRYDESVTYLSYASEGWRHVTSSYENPNNHIFHSLLISWLTDLLGDPPMVIRLPAFLAGCLLAPVAGWLGWQAHGRRAGVVAAVLVATSPVLVEYSTNARGYTMVALFTLLAVGVGRRVLDQPSPLWWLALGELAVLGLYTIPIMALPWTGITLWLAVNLWLDGDGWRSALSGVGTRLRRLLPLVLTNVAAGLITTALYWGVLRAEGLEAIAGNRFVAPLPWGEFWSVVPGGIWEVLGHWSRGLPAVLVAVAALGAALGLVQRRRGFRLPWAVAVGAVAFMLAKRNLGEARVWLWLLPLALTLAAGGLVVVADWIAEKMPRWRAAPWALAAVWGVWMTVVLTGSGSPVRASLETGGFPEAEEVALYIAERITPQDLVVTDFVSAAPLNYYLDVMQQQGIMSDPEASPDDVRRLWIIVNRGEARRVERLRTRLERLGAPSTEDATPVFRAGSAEVYLFGAVQPMPPPREAVDGKEVPPPEGKLAVRTLRNGTGGGGAILPPWTLLHRNSAPTSGPWPTT